MEWGSLVTSDKPIHYPGFKMASEQLRRLGNSAPVLGGTQVLAVNRGHMQSAVAHAQRWPVIDCS